MGSNRVQNVATPTATTDAANKGYVDSVKQALDIKDSVKLATTANLAAAYNTIIWSRNTYSRRKWNCHN